MSSRHTRRKAAKAKQLAKAQGLAMAERSMTIAAIVKQNRNAPNERNYYPPSINSVPAMKVAAQSIHFREPRASGGMSERAVQGLRARKGIVFGGADMLNADNAALAGERLSGRKIREASMKALAEHEAKVRGKK